MKPTEHSAHDGDPVASERIRAQGADSGTDRYAVDWALREQAVDEVLGELETRAAHRRGRRRRRTGIVAAASVLVVLLGLMWRPAREEAYTAPVAASTLISAPSRQVLPDGSVVELKDDAAIAVNFTAALRQITLRRGVAHFDVVKDEKKPFVVQVGGIEVRAVGTAFSVNFVDETSAEVLVIEGRVAVEKPAESADGSRAAATETLAFVDAGKRVVVGFASAAIGRVQAESMAAAEMAERLAWRVPRLEFSGTPLSEAIVMFNRYNRVQFALAEPALRDLKVSGFLRADKTETFIRLLETDFNLTAERRDADEIVLRRAR